MSENLPFCFFIAGLTVVKPPLQQTAGASDRILLCLSCLPMLQKDLLHECLGWLQETVAAEQKLPDQRLNRLRRYNRMHRKALLSSLRTFVPFLSRQQATPLVEAEESSCSPDESFVSQVLPENAKSLLFSLKELEKATCSFSPACIIGRGGFGVVYKGRLADGREVAIKKTREDIVQAHLTVQFQCEVSLLASVEHLNLVKLLGFCDGGDEKIMVQEYVSNGTLRQHLNCEFGEALSMSTRLDIAIDTAHALTYLHFYAERPIVHNDIKASNILLTQSLRAKITDFGFAQVGPLSKDAHYVSSQVKGTPGYLDPEYLRTRELSVKSDVYSFGIVLIELLTGRQPLEMRKECDERITVKWAFKKFLSDNVTSIIDPRLKWSEGVEFVAKEVSTLAFCCTAPAREDRPDMKQVGEKLWRIRKEYQSLLE